jgi:hypothetical protein
MNLPLDDLPSLVCEIVKLSTDIMESSEVTNAVVGAWLARNWEWHYKWDMLMGISVQRVEFGGFEDLYLILGPRLVGCAASSQQSN